MALTGLGFRVHSLWAMTALTGLLAACSASVARCGTPQAENSALPERDDALARALADIPFQKQKSADSLSDIALLANGDVLVVSDEGTELGYLRRGEKKGRAVDVLGTFTSFVDTLGGKAPKELDLEGAAAEGTRVLVAGSASLKRKKPEAGADNAARLREVELASGEGKPHSNYLFEIDAAEGQLTLVRSHDLRRLLLAQPVLEPFADLPSKDNGLDVEGVALRGDTAYVGLRGPVLRGHAVVARVGLANEDVALDFLALGGLGIRGMAAASDGGFWLLAGPTLDVTDPFYVYYWSGAGSVFASDGAGAGLTRSASVGHTDGEKPEGIFEQGGKLCILYEGAPGGGPRCMPRPSH